MSSGTARAFPSHHHIELVRSESSDGDGGWVAEVEEWPGCIAQGRSLDELEVNLERAMEAWSEAECEDGREIPPPRIDDRLSGQFRVRLPAGLHATLAREAARQGVSLNAFVSAALAGAVGWGRGQRA